MGLISNLRWPRGQDVSWVKLPHIRPTSLNLGLDALVHQVDLEISPEGARKYSVVSMMPRTRRRRETDLDLFSAYLAFSIVTMRPQLSLTASGRKLREPTPKERSVAMEKYRVSLTAEERAELEHVVSVGKSDDTSAQLRLATE
jgi:hypothetical protein